MNLSEFKKYFENDRSIKYFPEMVRRLHHLSVQGFVHFLPYGNVTFYSKKHEIIMLRGEKEYVHVSDNVDKSALIKTLHCYFDNNITYTLFCQSVAAAGICKWVVELDKGIIMFFSKNHDIILTLDISVYITTNTDSVEYFKASLENAQEARNCMGD